VHLLQGLRAPERVCCCGWREMGTHLMCEMGTDEGKRRYRDLTLCLRPLRCSGYCLDVIGLNSPTPCRRDIDWIV
jgi:hypothetical protein